MGAVVSLVMVRPLLLAHRRCHPSGSMASSITLLVLYGLLVVWTCLLRPAGNMVWFIVRYLGGRTPWATPMASDVPSPPPNWCGPESPRAWTSLYVQKEVRGRGLEHRQPHDLLVCYEGA